MPTPALPDEPRAAELVALLQLQPHPEGGWYRETFRAAAQVQPADGRPARSAITTIDFLLARGQASAWHRVVSDEVWHLLEGGPLVLWLMPPSRDRVDRVVLAAADAQGRRPCHTVPAGWWQAAQPEEGYAYVGATVGPGFDFADFAFLRGDAAGEAALRRLAPTLVSLL
ncbi:cupin domain-containing protein [Aquabacterium sp. J223]|uniref:cupin domain-containing protein n=1 Tax=Aquabacterium sp. J223 TaxID=2898431 RepID=UPI0021ADD00D|nr:cupin domain-containing protein [Aquabacterium sp. J223]UUX96422.1 cupin domain-containing protein [Aquabacterium sp. J223]